MKKYVIIVAGGKGLRMGGEVPKQFILLDGRPILMRTMDAFAKNDSGIQIILVLPQDQVPYWNSLCEKYSFKIPYQLAFGGNTRFHSVCNGLAFVTEESFVGIHDGVRPFVSKEVIKRCYEEARIKRAVIPVIDIVETVRRVTPDGSETVDRNNYKLVQTPQVFESSLLKRAYKQDYLPSFTDDASVVEALGSKIFLVEGNRENIKITTPYDINIASSLL